MDKRGLQNLEKTAVAVTLVLIAMVTLMLFIQDTSSGKLIHSQVNSKQAALEIDMARPGTDIMFSDNLTFERNNVLSKENSISFSYSHFNVNAVPGQNEVKING